MRIRAIGPNGAVFNDIYRAVFELHKKHFNAHTADDWISLAQDFGQTADSFGPEYYEFTTDLLEAVNKDIERNHK